MANKDIHKGGHEHNKKKDSQSKKDDVILMGAPGKEKKTADLPAKKPVSLPITEEVTKEEKETIEISNNSSSTHLNLGRLFFGLTALVLLYLILGKLFGWFGPVSIQFLAFWPLILIFIGLLLFKVKTTGAKIVGVVAVVLVLVASLSILFKGNTIARVPLSGEVVTEERGVESFDRILFEGVGTLRVTERDTHSVTVTADETVAGEVSVVEEDGLLTISYESSFWNFFLFDEAEVLVSVTAPNISSLSLNGSGSLEAETLSGEAASIVLTGSGDVTVGSVAAQELATRISGSGDVTVSGSADRQIVVISGSGEYNGSALKSTEAGVRISGSGDVVLAVDELLDVSISGSGDVEYIGSPELREGRVSGSGRIFKEGEEPIEESLEEESEEEVEDDDDDEIVSSGDLLQGDE